MGRGRAKAKQAKVARQLKYSSGGADFDRLEKELGVARSTPNDSSNEPVDERPGPAGQHGAEGEASD